MDFLIYIYIWRVVRRVILWLWVLIILVLFRLCTATPGIIYHENCSVSDTNTICSWIGLFHCCLSKFLLLVQSFIRKNTKYTFWILYRTIHYASFVRKYRHWFLTGQQIWFAFLFFQRLFLFLLKWIQASWLIFRYCVCGRRRGTTHL